MLIRGTYDLGNIWPRELAVLGTKDPKLSVHRAPGT